MEQYRREHDLENRKPPQDKDEAIIQLWYAVIGTNGSGLVSQMKDLRDELPNYVSQNTWKAYHEGLDKRTRRIERTFFAVIAIFGVLFGNKVITYLGQLFV